MRSDRILTPNEIKNIKDNHKAFLIQLTNIGLFAKAISLAEFEFANELKTQQQTDQIEDKWYEDKSTLKITP